MLQKQFPHVIIPPLPTKSSKQTQRHIKKCEKYYTRFMQAIGRSEELKSSFYLIEFVTQIDTKKFGKDSKNHLKQNFGKQLSDLVTKTGSVKVQMGSDSAAFCSRMGDYVDSYEILYKEMIDCSKEINFKSQELATQMF